MEVNGMRRTGNQPLWGQVYNTHFDGIGSEQAGWRPAVIFQNNMGNAHSPNVIVLPMTSSLKRLDMPTHVLVKKEGTGLRCDSVVICESPASISKERLGAYITTLPQEYMIRIAIASLLATSALDLLDIALMQDIKLQSAKINMAS